MTPSALGGMTPSALVTVGRDESRVSLDYKIPLVTSVLPSGDRRWWFRCATCRSDGRLFVLALC
jgi:hypothetical protein